MGDGLSKAACRRYQDSRERILQNVAYEHLRFHKPRLWLTIGLCDFVHSWAPCYSVSGVMRACRIGLSRAASQAAG
jgi:hypothetical protein